MKYWILPILALGCNEQKFHAIDENYSGGGVAIEVTPLSLNFGSMLPLEVHANKWIPECVLCLSK